MWLAQFGLPTHNEHGVNDETTADHGQVGREKRYVCRAGELP